MSACPALLTGDGGLAQGMAGLDCQLNLAVTAGYGRLFGMGGAFGATLTGLLTIYVAFIAFGLITGRTRLSLSTLTPRMLALALVLTFATAWPAYQAMVYGLLTGGPDQIAAALLGAPHGAARAFAARLDLVFEQMADLAKSLSEAGPANEPQVQTAVKLTWAAALMLLVSTAGLLIVARIVLAVLLALGPVFVVLALFPRTRGLFEGWLKTACALAFTPMLLTLGGAGVLAALGPVITAIGEDPAGAVAESRPILTLFLGATIYVLLLVALAWAAANITRGWRPFGGAGETLATTGPGPQASPAMTLAALDGRPALDARTAAVVAAVSGSPAGSRQTHVDRRTAIAPPPAALAPQASTRRAAARPRTEGLGQRHRPPPSAAPLSANPGS